jgi:hypothetical protein
MRPIYLALLAVALSACRSSPTDIAPIRPASAQELYLCCNMHTESDWLSDGNFLVGRLLPAGAPVRILSETRGVANLEVGNQRFRLGHEYGVQQESYETFRDKYLVANDPRAVIDSYAPQIRDAIRMGRIVRGMTRAQVIAAIGYPPAHGTASLEAPEWTYWHSRFVRYGVLFDATGRVRDVNANEWIRRQVLATG